MDDMDRYDYAQWVGAGLILAGIFMISGVGQGSADVSQGEFLVLALSLIGLGSIIALVAGRLQRRKRTGR